MKQIKPPDALDPEKNRLTVFLAGSIEQGGAEDWQARIVDALSDLDIVILNPRRDVWDASWPQEMAYQPFRDQVEWELAAQEQADVIAFYFSPTTKAPITLLELGLAAGRRQAVVCCPEGFWRRGNVQIVCERYGISQVATVDDLMVFLRSLARPN